MQEAKVRGSWKKMGKKKSHGKDSLLLSTAAANCRWMPWGCSEDREMVSQKCPHRDSIYLLIPGPTLEHSFNISTTTFLSCTWEWAPRLCVKPWGRLWEMLLALKVGSHQSPRHQLRIHLGTWGDPKWENTALARASRWHKSSFGTDQWLVLHERGHLWLIVLKKTVPMLSLTKGKLKSQ